MIPLIDMLAVTREFKVGASVVSAVRGIDLRVLPGEQLAIVGPSGSGKSTMMNMLGLLDTPSSGTYLLEGQDTLALPPAVKSRLRNQAIGFVFQQFHLLPNLTALENVQLPLLYRGVTSVDMHDAAVDALSVVGMAHRLDHRPAQLSGGEKQRVAIARAITGRPRLLLADEPTGALDSVTGAKIVEVLLGASERSGAALIIITHDAGVARCVPRRISMRDGGIIASEPANA